MTQPPSPSAAALEKDSVLLWQLMQTKAWHSADAPEQIEIIDAALRKFAAQAVAAERAKPAASDPPPLDDFIEARQIVGHAEDKYIAYMKEHINRPVQRLPMRAFEFFRDEIAAALAERGARERERAAKIAETLDCEDVAAAIRDQTLT